MNGSPRKNGNTSAMLKEIVKIAEKKGASTTYVDLVDMEIHDCKACMKCKKEEGCSQRDDMDKLRPLVRDADFLLLGSPVYMGDETGMMKCFSDRLYAFLKPSDTPGEYESRLEGGKKAMVLFTCQMPDGDKIYNYISIRYFRLLIKTLGYHDIRTFIIGGALPSMDLRETPRAKAVLEEAARFLQAP